MTQYIAVDQSGRVCCAVGRVDPQGMHGPASPPPAQMGGADVDLAYHLWNEPVSFSAPFPGAVLALEGKQVIWRDERTLADAKASAIVRVDQFADAARLALASGPTRMEHEDAQRAAEQYRDAGYTGPVPEPVAAWTYAKRRDGWTDRQAADDILAAASRDLESVRKIRRIRLDTMEAIRAATSCAETEALATSFRPALVAEQPELASITW